MKIFYSAYTLKNNTGDLLINKLQIEEYARYGEVYVDCYGMPEYFQKIIFQSGNQNVKNFESIYNAHYRSWKMFKIIQKLKHDGFTHFTKSPGPFPFLKFPLKTFNKIRRGGDFAIPPSLFFHILYSPTFVTSQRCFTFVTLKKTSQAHGNPGKQDI